MSHTLHDAINIPEVGIGGGHLYPPQSAPAQAPLGVSNFVDGSGPIFSMYSEMATEEDKKIAESWKADADGILIFTGLFSAAVASLISVSIQDIRQNPQDTSNFYLANIYQTLTDPGQPNISSFLPASPPPFSPPTYAVWVNALWFLSLVISLTCALLATLLQQWARRYLKVTQPRYSPHKRARIRAFLSEGVENLLLPWTVETLPTLLHISLFLFFAGLVVFMWNVNFTLFKLVLSWVGICTALYGCITVTPIFRHDSPYYTPLSLPAWHIITGTTCLIFQALRRLALLDCFSYRTYRRFDDLAESYGQWLVQGMQKTVEETALNSPSEIDTRAFLWTFDCSDEDHELERFFSGLPGFRNSKVVKDPLPSLTEERKVALFTALTGLLDRLFSSDLLPEPVKYRRAILCMKAIDPAENPDACRWILRRIIYGDQHEGLRTAAVGHIVRGWADILSGNQDTAFVVPAILASIISRAQRRNDSWFSLASDQLGIAEAILRDHAVHGDSLSLVILIHVTRQQFSHYLEVSWPVHEISTVLEAASKFNVQDTSPELQHDFCALWNQIVRKVQNENAWSTAFYILGRIRNVYAALHQGTDSAPTRFSAATGDKDAVLWEPSSYPVCNISSHHPNSTPHNDLTPETFIPAVPHHHDNSAPVPSFFASSPYTHSLSAHVPHCVDENLADALPYDNYVSTPVISHSIDHATTESRRIPTTSPNPGFSRATHGSIDTSARTMYLSTPEPSTFTSAPKSKASTSPPETVAVRHTADACAHSNDLNVPSSASPPPVLDGIPPLEYHPSMLVAPATPFASCPPSASAPDLGEDEGNPKAGSRMHFTSIDHS